MIRPRASALFVAWKVASTFALPLVRRQEAEGGISFQYQGNNGPNLWPGFCQDINPGQSPVDIRPGSADANSGALQATLQPLTGVKLENSGHGLEFILPEGGPDSSFVAAGQAEVFKITGFHIHCPSEHRYEGKYFDAEVHFVGASPSGKTSVMAVMFEVSEQPLADNLMSVVAKQLPLNGKKTVDLPPFDLSSVQVATGNLTGFHTYVGSLTTPPCTTGVLWNVIDKPVPISISEMLAIRREQGFTSRFVQVARDEPAVFNAPIQPSVEAASASGNVAALELPIGDAPAGGPDTIQNVENSGSIQNFEGVAPSTPSELVSSVGGESGHSEKRAHASESQCADCESDASDTPEYHPHGEKVSHEAWSAEQASDCNQDDVELSSSQDLSESAAVETGTAVQAVSAEPETAADVPADSSAEEVATPDASSDPAATSSLPPGDPEGPGDTAAAESVATDATETEQIETEAASAEAVPVEGAPAEFDPNETGADAAIAEVAPAEGLPAEPAPEAGSGEAVTAESPAEADAAEAAPTEDVLAEPPEVATGESVPPEVDPAAAAPPEDAAIESVPTDISPPEAAPAETASSGASPLETAPAEVDLADAAVPDAAPPDAAVPEAAPPDAAAPEAVPPDSAAPEAAPEAAPPEAAPPEAAALETAPPEAALPEAAPPEVAPSEAAAPDAAAGEADPPNADQVEASPTEDTAAVAVSPSEGAPPEAVDVQAEQVEAAPVEVVPPEAAPAEAEPAGPAPAEAAPAEPGPNAAVPAETPKIDSSPAEAVSEAPPVEVVSEAATV